MATTTGRMGIHFMPPTGWLNDPNGLCVFRGTFHVFHQYSPNWPASAAPRGWGHFYSDDLVHWKHQGMVIAPDTPDDASGAYSGSALVVPGAAADGGDALYLYYTGNVKEPGEHDYVHEGRRANQILVTSDDGFSFSPKRVLLRNVDYPTWCTRHVRDPKVWEQDGKFWMILGARTQDDEGVVLLYSSTDGMSWSYRGVLRPRAPFGFMWECPDRIALDGHEYLAVSPQGMQKYPWSHGLRDQAGYFALGEQRVIDAAGEADAAGAKRAADAAGEKSAVAASTAAGAIDPVNPVDVASSAGATGATQGGTLVVDESTFRLWDEGFDFYAPQTFVDNAGRTLLIAWMGIPEAPYLSMPAGMSWEHCLTVPRVLVRRADGGIAQLPVPELDELHGEQVTLELPGSLTLPEHRADVRIEGIEGRFDLALDNALQISFCPGELRLAFVGEAAGRNGVGAGRMVRSIALEHLDNVRVLVDDTAVEVFVNDGAHALATRWFPVDSELSIAATGRCAQAAVWPMGDGMRDTYR